MITVATAPWIIGNAIIAGMMVKTWIETRREIRKLKGRS